MGALRAEGIRFQLIGMAAGVLQGVPAMTFDVDLWLDLAPRQYMRGINVALRVGAVMLRNTVVELTDGTLVNFVYAVTGLRSFDAEFHKARLLKFHGQQIPVMPLESILSSKQAIGRPKDLVHQQLIRQTLRLQRKQTQRGKLVREAN
jgi:hypothetical protein